MSFIRLSIHVSNAQATQLFEFAKAFFRYLNRELNRTKLLGSYGFFPKATWFRLLNGNEDDYDDDNDQNRANYQGKYFSGLSRNQHNVTLVGSENFFHRCAIINDVAYALFNFLSPF